MGSLKMSAEEIQAKHAEGTEIANQAFYELLELNNALMGELTGAQEAIGGVQGEPAAAYERTAELEAQLAEYSDKLSKKQDKYAKLHEKYETLKAMYRELGERSSSSSSSSSSSDSD